MFSPGLRRPCEQQQSSKAPPPRSTFSFRRWLISRRAAFAWLLRVVWPADLPFRPPRDWLARWTRSYRPSHLRRHSCDNPHAVGHNGMRLVSELYSHPISVELSTPFAPSACSCWCVNCNLYGTPVAGPVNDYLRANLRSWRTSRSYQAGPLGCAVQVRSCSSRLMTSWMNAMSSTTAKWVPSLIWTCRRELVKRPQPRACLRDT